MDGTERKKERSGRDEESLGRQEKRRGGVWIEGKEVGGEGGGIHGRRRRSCMTGERERKRGEGVYRR